MPPRNGMRRIVDGKTCVWYEGYWVRYYPPPPNTWAAKKRLIDNLTRRLFHHTEGGINTPGEKLDEARRAYERETDLRRRRVNGAMLAGALFNRAADIFTTVVELSGKGVHIRQDNDLLHECEACFEQALELGREVRHFSGEEGIDELWGEPLKAFVMPIKDFYQSRYLKVALTMRDIDRIADVMTATFDDDPVYAPVPELVAELRAAAKLEAETLRTDPMIFAVWPRFVAACEAISAFRPRLGVRPTTAERRRAGAGTRLLRDGKDVVTWIAGARVPMPKTTHAYLERCRDFAYKRGIVIDLDTLGT